jgi:hypothetical protein
MGRMKFCKDCKWCVGNNCAFFDIDLVTGERRHTDAKDMPWCKYLRRDERCCGFDARFFEPIKEEEEPKLKYKDGEWYD